MSQLIEEWKPVVGFKGCYEVSDWGRVKSLARMVKHWRGGWSRVPEKILTPIPNSGGYLEVGLSKNGKATKARVHLLVWDAFVGEDRTGLQVNHIDEDKNNNAVWNLNLMTAKENSNWGTGIERSAKARSKAVIACNPETMEIVYEFPSITEAARNGYNLSAVSNACRGCYMCKGNHRYKGLFWQWA